MTAIRDDARLIATASQMSAPGKGLLAIDESPSSCDKRLAAVGIAQTGPMRQAWRDVLITTPGLGTGISGAILSDETFGQDTRAGIPFVRTLESAGILPGIKVDLGAKALAGHPGEKVTEGLDGLRERLAAYVAQGARFAKWRAVLLIAAPLQSVALPSEGCISANAHALARYAALCQEAGLVPIVEPEVLMDGEHSLERCAAVTEQALRGVFSQLYLQGVLLEGMILKPAMVLPGSGVKSACSVDAVADATLRCLRRSVPPAVAGIAFLSGGQPAVTATAHLNAIQLRARAQNLILPWPVTFSYGRALQAPALQIWAGVEQHRDTAQQALLHRARCNSSAQRGEYTSAMEAA